MPSFTRRVRRAILIMLGGERLRSDPLFDAAWYRWAYPNSPRTARAAARHYTVVGGVERVPSADFAPSWFISR